MTSERVLEIEPGCDIRVHELGTGSGPVLTVLGGVHGDELEGVFAATLLTQLASMWAGDEEIEGTLRVVPVCNPAAFAAQTRCTPQDGENLARQFPGSTSGSLTARIARALTTEVIAGSDLLVDLHSAGQHYAMPVFAGYVQDLPTSTVALEACRVFDAPLLWHHRGTGPGRTMSAAEELGIPSLYVEGSGGGGLRGVELDIYLRGLRRLLAWLGLTREPLDEARGASDLHGADGDVDSSLASSHDGYCITRVVPGEVVEPDQVIAEIVSVAGATLEVVRNPQPDSASVMMLRRTAQISRGDGVAMLGPVPFLRPSQI